MVSRWPLLSWKYRAEGGINGWMPVAGDTIVLPVGNARPPGILALSVPADR